MAKSCPSTSKYATNPLYICNTNTGRWVKKTSKIGKTLVNIPSPNVLVPPPNVLVPPPNVPCSSKSKLASNPLYICNPATKRWVLKTSSIGRRLLSTPPTVPTLPVVPPTVSTLPIAPPVPTLPIAPTVPTLPIAPPVVCSSKSKLASNPLYICNPVTKRWVLKTSAIGRRLLNPIVPIPPSIRSLNKNIITPITALSPLSWPLKGFEMVKLSRSEFQNLIDIYKHYHNLPTKGPDSFSERECFTLQELVPQQNLLDHNKVVLFHGTSLEHFKNMKKRGVNPIGGGLLGKGFYLSPNFSKANSYSYKGGSRRVILEVEVQDADCILVSCYKNSYTSSSSAYKCNDDYPVHTDKTGTVWQFIFRNQGDMNQKLQVKRVYELP